MPPLWTPPETRVRASALARFLGAVAGDESVKLDTIDDLHAFSVREAARFWRRVADFAGIVAETWGETVLESPGALSEARFFPDARLNYAENLLRRRDDTDALVFWSEDVERRRLSHRALHDQVSRVAGALRAAGVGPGDRVAAYLPNLPETVIAMLAAASLGAVWSSCSPDFGVQGVVDRFGQIRPKVLFAVAATRYGGKVHGGLDKLGPILANLPSVERTVVVPYADPDPDLSGLPGAVSWDSFLGGHEPGPIPFAHLPFDHPLFIMFSSGTTGKPKCIVHRAGGVLIEHMKEHLLHCDVRPGDRVFYFTTCGWMMWNWLVSMLASRATVLLYDGSPFHPDGNILFDYADAEGMTLFGTSAKYIDAVRKVGLRPAATHRLETVRLIASTGSPLVAESFDFVYDHVKADVQLASISGGTDILGCFVLGNPMGPVWRGEVQCRSLGLAVDVFDDDGKPVRGAPGELVCTAPFPSMPLGFWDDPDGARYRAAYFERFPGVWCHGDWVELTEHGGMIIHGRSDATLNPGGVRIGTAEIYRQVERFDEVVESLAVGQRWQDDERIVLFVRLRDGTAFDDDLVKRLKDRIRRECSPRHVPAVVVAVSDIPRTVSGKITELAVRDVIHGRPVRNREALANPEALELFRDLPELRS